MTVLGVRFSKNLQFFAKMQAASWPCRALQNNRALTAVSWWGTGIFSIRSVF